MQRRIVLSGVSLTTMGAFSVFKDALGSLAADYSDRYEIYALVHKASLFDIPGVIFVEFPNVKTSWIRRLRFEYFDCRKISEELAPCLWFAMHDITPIVRADVKAVYCHNPSPFYRFNLREAPLSWKFSLFTLFYQYVYGFNINSNDFVVVQQNWIRKAFMVRYKLKNVVVAHPAVEHLPKPTPAVPGLSNRPYRFFYPAYPWAPYKNLDQVLRAVRILEQDGFHGFEVWLTTNGQETRYAEKIRRHYGELRSVKWMGLLPRSEVLRIYEEIDCLLFPSRLETWGMPITEFKVTGKPILVADLPYAHETVGRYHNVAFFDTSSDSCLAEVMRKVVSGEEVFGGSEEQQIASPFSRNWPQLWEILLSRSTDHADTDRIEP